jgi:hypothetical protein
LIVVVTSVGAAHDTDAGDGMTIKSRFHYYRRSSGAT